jgi:hypothetical protein
MNAYELADWITKEYVVMRCGKEYEISVMLRQQADRIVALEQKHKDAFDYIEKLLKERQL